MLRLISWSDIRSKHFKLRNLLYLQCIQVDTTLFIFNGGDFVCCFLLGRFHSCNKLSLSKYQETIDGHGTVPGKVTRLHNTIDESMREGHEGARGLLMSICCTYTLII